MAETYQQAQRQGFEQAIRDGRYDAGFEHGEKARRLFDRVLGGWLMSRVQRAQPLSVLEVGCGTGAWLAYLHGLAAGRPLALHGFDLTGAMVELARANLSEHDIPAALHHGDVLDPTAYRFDAHQGGGFDLIFAYDLVQQLPRPMQWRAVEAMLAQLAPGGVLIVFDHERWSRYGLRMAWRKFLTRWGPIEFVPRFYCNARYPMLDAFARRLRRQGLRVETQAMDGFAKRALAITV